MKLAYSSSFIEITVRVNTCSFSSRVSHSLMLATLNYQVGVLFCSAVTLCFLKLNTWLPIFLFFSIWSSWLWKGHSLCYQHITCEKRKCSSFVENYFTVRFCVVFMATDADGKKGGKMKFAIYFFIETQRWVSHLVFWCHWLVKLALAERDSENAMVSFLVFMCVHAKWGWGGGGRGA